MGDYPTEDELLHVETFQGPARDWLAYIRGIWWASEWGWDEEDATDDFNRPVTRYRVSTGGWSGNEDIIETMTKNPAWYVTWVQSRRGGHYIFEVPVDP